MTDTASARTGRLILVPAVITLGVTLLRLVGERQGWSPALFSREPGGGGALVMLAAILGNWGTHYDVMPPGAPAMSGLYKWFMIGLLPQLTIWLWFTVAIGGLFGIAAGAIAARGR